MWLFIFTKGFLSEGGQWCKVIEKVLVAFIEISNHRDACFLIDQDTFDSTGSICVDQSIGMASIHQYRLAAVFLVFRNCVHELSLVCVE